MAEGQRLWTVCSRAAETWGDVAEADGQHRDEGEVEGVEERKILLEDTEEPSTTTDEGEKEGHSSAGCFEVISEANLQLLLLLLLRPAKEEEWVDEEEWRRYELTLVLASQFCTFPWEEPPKNIIMYKKDTWSNLLSLCSFSTAV